MKRNLILAPGPTEIPPQFREVLGRPMIHHRTPQFQDYLRQAVEGLQYVLQTVHDVYFLASSGTGAMEASVVSFCSPGDKVVTVESGKFGERWTGIAKAYGLDTQVIEAKWGQSVDPKEIEKRLEQNPEIKAVYITLCETSTGTSPDIAAIGRIVKKTEAILVVDAVSGLGVADLQTDAWAVDVTASGSHKGLMLPPGVGIVSVSPKAAKRMETARCSSYYFNLKKYAKAWEKNDTPFTPAISTIIALTKSLEMFRRFGMDNAFENYARLANGLREGISALGLELFARPPAASNVLTSVKVPDGIQGEQLVGIMRDTYGITIAGGQGSLKGKIFRIAHIGCLDEYDMLIGLSCLEKVLKQLGYRFELGSGVAAAQKYFNSG